MPRAKNATRLNFRISAPAIRITMSRESIENIAKATPPVRVQIVNGVDRGQFAARSP
jgi:hypothetical protein